MSEGSEAVMDTGSPGGMASKWQSQEAIQDSVLCSPVLPSMWGKLSSGLLLNFGASPELDPNFLVDTEL